MEADGIGKRHVEHAVVAADEVGERGCERGLLLGRQFVEAADTAARENHRLERPDCPERRERDEMRVLRPGRRALGGRSRPRNAKRRAIGPKLRGFLCTRKPRRFAGTAWWGMQGSN